MPSVRTKDAAGRERDDASIAVDDLLFGDTPEAHPVLDALFEPQKSDLRQIVRVLGIGVCHGTILSTSAASAVISWTAATLYGISKTSRPLSIALAKSARSVIELVSARGS
jgi:hypothetical protein